MTTTIKRWLPVFLWAIVIFYLSSLPSLISVERNILDFILKKGAHVTEYAIFFFLLKRALNSYPKAFLIGLFYAFTDETHQLFVPGRTGMIRDVLLFDLLGLTLSWLILYIRQYRWKKH